MARPRRERKFSCGRAAVTSRDVAIGLSAAPTRLGCAAGRIRDTSMRPASDSREPNGTLARTDWPAGEAKTTLPPACVIAEATTEGAVVRISTRTPDELMS